ncbi:MAG: hypothetical protein IPO93_09495 [Actinobacteria bacterium]|nr:hypothetical protein [Actinomycetota bacterium]
MTKPLLVLISGPYLTGTGGDETKIAGNLARMEAMALPVYERGHLAVVAEWLSWPLIKQAGGTSHASEEFRQFQYPAAHRLLTMCDAVLRIPGDSRGADAECELARRMGLSIYTSVEELPYAT